MNIGESPLGLLLRLLDAVVVVLGGVAAYGLRFGVLFPERDYLILMVISVLLVFLFFPLFNLYRSWRGDFIIDLAGRLATAWGTVFLALTMVMFALKFETGFSRIWFFLWGGLAGLGLILLRLAAYAILRALRQRGLYLKRIALVGKGPMAQDILGRIRTTPSAGFEVVEQFAPYGHPVGDHVRPLDDLPRLVQAMRLDEVWIALPLRDEAVIHDVLHLLRHEPLDIRYAPDISTLRLINHSINDILGMPMLDLRASPMTGVNRMIKWLEDRLLALIALILASPFMVLIALGVKLSSPGPILFKQKRHGWGGREIIVYKFRTMRISKDEDTPIKQATRDDPRVTRFGAFLRKTSLDELPQLFNVLQGRMSLVGPRPHAIEHNEYYKERIDRYMLRHKVKPGITGWAQVNGYRGETDTLEKMQKRVEYDLYYIEHWSLWFDLKILFLTLFKGFTDKNAY
ncbi:MAG: undecaprenyl-phosphate glucose phosphotransferase [Halothiobacillaceae bacterium]